MQPINLPISHSHYAASPGRAVLTVLMVGILLFFLSSYGYAQGDAQESLTQIITPASLFEEVHSEALNNTDSLPKPAPHIARDERRAPQPAGKSETASNGDWGSPQIENPNFDIVIESGNSDIKALLEEHLELFRFRMLSDLTALELRRLLERTQENIRSLTGTQGYFSPKIDIEVIPALERQSPSALPLIRIQVEPGIQTTIADMELQFEGDILNYENDLLINSQKRRLGWGWAMRAGDPFSQSGWSNAKSNMLSRLTAQYFPAGRISASQASIDPITNTAKLSITLDSGPRFFLGEHLIIGLERYPERLVRNFTRLREGEDFLQEDIMKAQQRLAESGYFESVFLFVNPEDPNPEAAKVNVMVREAHYQKMTFGPGFSTDNGPRLTLEYRHNQVPLLGWQAITNLHVDADNQRAELTLSAIPDDNYWRKVLAGRLENLDANNEQTHSVQLSFGRSFISGPVDKNYFIQYDQARTTNLNGTTRAQAVSANVGWTWRNFNNLNAPRRGWGIGLELAAGSTFGDSGRTPFVRVRTKGALFIPMENRRNGRFVLRGEFGGVFAKEGEPIPTPLMFRTGGDGTVRGYAFRYIGVNEGNDVTTSGRYMGVASVEYQRPIIINDRPSEFDWAIFTDTGAVSNRLQDLHLYSSVGAGVRWRSPVGPLSVDLAYGIKTSQVRLHFNIGFVF